MGDVISLLRWAGYPYDTPGEFYAVAIRDFSTFLLVGGMLAGALAAMDVIAVAPVIAMIFIFLSLRRPYVRLKALAKKRAESLRNNMLIGLSVLSSLLSSGVGVQEALRRASTVGGPFCNLLGLLVARMEVEDFTKAIEVTAPICLIPRMWKRVSSCVTFMTSSPTTVRYCPACRACRSPCIVRWWRRPRNARHSCASAPACSA
jgi:hypothetical protein